MRSGFRKKLDDWNLKMESLFRKHQSRKSARLRLKRMHGGYACDREYKEIVLPYWKKYGYKPAKMWYQIFCDSDQKMDPRYIPDDLFYGELVPYFSNSQFRRFGEDKCYHDVWFPEVKRPETVCKNIAGVFYDKDMNVISAESALQLCMKFAGEFLIKPSIDSGEGRLITFYTPGAYSQADLEKAFSEMGANFIAQAAVKQHPSLARLNPSSLNTIRVVSFFFEGQVHILSCILRMGATNAKVDNVGAGGYACPILEGGQLNARGVNRKAEWREENQNGIRFSDVVVPSFDRVLDTVRECHKRMAHFKLIGWDFAVDVEEDPVLIEYNVCPGANQVTCGPTFGDLTEKVLDEYFLKRTLARAQN